LVCFLGEGAKAQTNGWERFYLAMTLMTMKKKMMMMMMKVVPELGAEDEDGSSSEFGGSESRKKMWAIPVVVGFLSVHKKIRVCFCFFCPV
jgi:hypothetical protein